VDEEEGEEEEELRWTVLALFIDSVETNVGDADAAAAAAVASGLWASENLGDKEPPAGDSDSACTRAAKSCSGAGAVEWEKAGCDVDVDEEEDDGDDEDEDDVDDADEKDCLFAAAQAASINGTTSTQF
jgi:hypothetical protein